MVCRSKVIAMLIFMLALSPLLFGCFSYQMVKRSDGDEFSLPDNTLRINETTLGVALAKLGAPDQLLNIEGRDVLLYQRSVFRQNRLSFGIPVFDTWGRAVDLSVFGGLEGNDTLALFFTPDGVLRQMVVEKAAARPFFKTMLEN